MEANPPKPTSDDTKSTEDTQEPNVEPIGTLPPLESNPNTNDEQNEANMNTNTNISSSASTTPISTAVPATPLPGQLASPDKLSSTSPTTTTTKETQPTNVDEEEEEEEEPSITVPPPPSTADTRPSLSRSSTTASLYKVPSTASFSGRPRVTAEKTKLSSLKTQLSDMKDPDTYVDRFEEEVAPSGIKITSISLDQAEATQKSIEEEQRLREAEEEQRLEKAQIQVAAIESKAREKIQDEVAARSRDALEREKQMNRKTRTQIARIQAAFRRAESQLKSALATRKGEVVSQYGELEYDDGLYTGVKQRRYRVDWSKTPQPTQIRIEELRAVKDKLPKGRYCMAVSMFDSLGGYPLRWSKVKGEEWCGSTLPVRHAGRFTDTDLKFESNLFTVAPSKPEIRPAMCFLFQLYLLKGKHTPVDIPVAWGAFPICNSNFDVIRGKYKLPMLKGGYDPKIEKWETLEETYSYDIDNWLGNLYIEVTHLPRYSRGQKEYEVELEYTSALLAYPSRQDGSDNEADQITFSLNALGDDEDDDDGEDDDEDEELEAGIVSARAGAGVGGVGGGGGSRQGILRKRRGKGKGKGMKKSRSGLTADIGQPGSKRRMRKSKSAASFVTNAPNKVSDFYDEEEEHDDDGEDDTTLDDGSFEDATDETLSPNSAGRSGAGVFSDDDEEEDDGEDSHEDEEEEESDEYDESSGEEDSADDDDDDDGLYIHPNFAGSMSARSFTPRNVAQKPTIGGMSNAPGFKLPFSSRSGFKPTDSRKSTSLLPSFDPEEGTTGWKKDSESGLHYRVHGGVDLATLDYTAPLTGRSTVRRKAKPLTRAQKLEQYRIAVSEPIEGFKKYQEGSRKIQYLKREMLTEMGLARVRTFEFWATMMLLLFAIWLRIYSHYFGGYLALTMLRVPIIEFSFEVYTVRLTYTASLLPLAYEIVMTFVGTVFNIALLSLFVTIAWLWQKISHSFPESTSKFVFVFGLATVLDPLLILAVDLAIGNEEGDAFKLFNRFQEREGNGVAGIFITSFLYICCILLSSFLLFNYLLKVHLNGRMLDIYRRLHADDSKFFVPNDMEVSTRELRWICVKAERWRGEDGSRRKIAVFDYIRTDVNDYKWKEVTTHLSIYNLGINGAKELYRQFLRFPDGSIIELFGTLNDLGSHELNTITEIRSGAINDFLKGSLSTGQLPTTSLSKTNSGTFAARRNATGTLVGKPTGPTTKNRGLLGLHNQRSDKGKISSSSKEGMNKILERADLHLKIRNLNYAEKDIQLIINKFQNEGITSYNGLSKDLVARSYFIRGSIGAVRNSTNHEPNKTSTYALGAFSDFAISLRMNPSLESVIQNQISELELSLPGYVNNKKKQKEEGEEEDNDEIEATAPKTEEEQDKNSSSFSDLEQLFSKVLLKHRYEKYEDQSGPKGKILLPNYLKTEEMANSLRSSAVPSLLVLSAKTIADEISSEPEVYVDTLHELNPTFLGHIFSRLSWSAFQVLRGHAPYKKYCHNLALYEHMTAQENYLRKLLLSHRSHPDLNDPYVSLIDAFKSRKLLSYEVCEGEEASIPKILDHRTAIYEGEPAIVDEATFRRHFDVFSEGQLRGIDWSNVFVAGGSILGCLSKIPKGKNSSDLERYFHILAYPRSDIDLFIWGLSEQESTAKVRELYDVIMAYHSAGELSRYRRSKLRQKPTTPTPTPRVMEVIRTKNAITFVSQGPYRHIQIILRAYKSPLEILSGFDVDCCCVGFDGSKVWVHPRAARAIKMRYNLVDLSRRSPTYEKRLFKYSKRGFSVAIPGLDSKPLMPIPQWIPLLRQLNRESFCSPLRRLLIRDNIETRFASMTRPPYNSGLYSHFHYDPSNDTSRSGSDYSHFSIPYYSAINHSTIMDAARRCQTQSEYVRLHQRTPPEDVSTYCLFGSLENCLSGYVSTGIPMGTRTDDNDRILQTFLHVDHEEMWMIDNPSAQGLHLPSVSGLVTGSFQPTPMTFKEWSQGCFQEEEEEQK